jgi:hypothetical protein
VRQPRSHRDSREAQVEEILGASTEAPRAQQARIAAYYASQTKQQQEREEKEECARFAQSQTRGYPTELPWKLSSPLRHRTRPVLFRFMRSARRSAQVAWRNNSARPGAGLLTFNVATVRPRLLYPLVRAAGANV